MCSFCISGSVVLLMNSRFFQNLGRIWKQHTAACPALLFLKISTATLVQAHTSTYLNHIWNWSCVAVSGWIWTAKNNLQYWHKIYYPGHRPFTTNASYFNLIKCWQVYLARHRLRKWSNGRVEVSTDVWKVWGRRLFNHKHYNVQCC